MVIFPIKMVIFLVKMVFPGKTGGVPEICELTIEASFFAIIPSGHLLHKYGNSPLFVGNTHNNMPYVQ